MKVVVTAVSATLILCWRASALASPTEVPASTLPARGIAPVRASIASRRVVLPLWKGPTSAMHRGPNVLLYGGLLTSCPIRRLLMFGARPLIGSANEYALPAFLVWQVRNRRCAAASRKPKLSGRHCEERKRRSNPSLSAEIRGLLRGACHRAALCAAPLARDMTKDFNVPA